MTRFGQQHFDDGMAKGIQQGPNEGRMERWIEGWIEGWIQGWIEGWRKGWMEGRVEGELARLLEKRFGDIPSGVRERISTADLPSLESWLERVLDAPDLQSVFGPTN